jgi:hypothetical protein
LYFEEIEHTFLTAGEPVKENWIHILLDSHDSEGKTRFWKFDFLETWEVNLYGDAVKVQRDPFNADNFYLTHIKDSLPPKICWVTKPSNEILIATTTNNSKNELKRFTVNSLGPGGNRLRIRYSILVRQYSLSEDLYNYLKLLKNVNENTGGLYSTLPAPVFGNIFSSNENEKALGYFTASSVKEKRLFILNSEHHVNTVSANNGCTYYDFISPDKSTLFFGPSVSGKKLYSIPGDCYDCIGYGAKEKPSFW